MKRNLEELSDTTFDLLVIGGGIHGAWAAWDATLRGLSVALVEQGDFGAATSANSLKIMHGGLRYLQQMNLRRMRESIRERAALARIAPDLVRPMPFLVPADGGLTRRIPALRLAMAATDLIGWDRNRGLAPEVRIPAGRVVSADECLRLFPGFEPDGVRGGAIWYDYQLHASEWLPIAVLQSASERGARLANYLRAEELVVRDGRVVGIRARDTLNGDELEIRARMTLNAAGPWADQVAGSAVRNAGRRDGPPARALAINLVVRRSFSDVAVGLRAATSRAGDPVCGGNRFLFLTPWRDSTLIGTSYHLCGDPAPSPSSGVREEHLQAFVDECNGACRWLGLSLDDITSFHHGWLPLKAGRERGRPDALAQRPRLTDHAAEDGIGGLISAEGVKYTTARGLAERAVDLVFRRLGHASPPCRTADTPIQVGRSAAAAPFVRSDIVRIIREEMALKLSDVVLRRTGMGLEACPPREQVNAVVGICGETLGWDESRREAEVRELLEAYAPLRPL